MRCHKCGTEIQEDSNFCSRCGIELEHDKFSDAAEPIPPRHAVARTGKRVSAMAVVAFLLGIGGFVFSLLTAVPAIFVGAAALKEIKKNPDTLEGRGFAWTGLLLGLFFTLLVIAVVVMFFVAPDMLEQWREYLPETAPPE